MSDEDELHEDLPDQPPPAGLPEVPKSWAATIQQVRLLVRDVSIIVTLLISLVTAVTSIWTHGKVDKVETRQEVNSVKLDEVKVAAEDAKIEAAEVKTVAKDHAKKIDAKLEVIDKKADDVKRALPK